MFSDVVQILPIRIQNVLDKINSSTKQGIREIHMKSGHKLYVNYEGNLFFISENGTLCIDDGILVFAEDVTDCIYKACDYSLYSYEEDIANGFITIKGGNRLGLCGTAVFNQNKTRSIKEISSINIRIASEVRGCADSVFPFCETGDENILILSKPAAGKTTILRDIARLFSYSGKRTCIIDERGELGAVYNGTSPFDFGDFCDIFDRYPKAEGIMTATRTMSPDVIIIDEIGSPEETIAISHVVNCGVKVIASAHADSFECAMNRPQIKKMIQSNIFTKIIVLSRMPHPCTVKAFIKVKDDECEIINHDSGVYCSDISRFTESLRIEKTACSATGNT